MPERSVITDKDVSGNVRDGSKLLKFFNVGKRLSFTENQANRNNVYQSQNSILRKGVLQTYRNLKEKQQHSESEKSRKNMATQNLWIFEEINTKTLRGTHFLKTSLILTQTSADTKPVTPFRCDVDIHIPIYGITSGHQNATSFV